MGKLHSLFFGSLPEYFYLNDSYKDGNGAGLLERFLSIFEEEAEKYVGDIENLQNILNPLLTVEDYLNLIAIGLGNPPKPFDYSDWYRKILHSIILINQYKGTVEGFKRWFVLFDCSVNITTSARIQIRYDSGELYDTPGNQYLNGCMYCSYWSIEITDPNHNLTVLESDPLGDSIKLGMQVIFDYLLPINVILQTFTYNGVEKNIDLGPNNIILIAGSYGGDSLLAQEANIPISQETNKILTP